MRIDGHAAPVVRYAQRAVGFEFHFYAIGKPGNRFVHGVVEHFGEEVVQRAFVDAADIHSRSFPNRFESFENLDVLGGIATSRGRRRFAASKEVVVPEFLIAVFGHRRFLLRLRHGPLIGRFAPVQQWRCCSPIQYRVG